ncbi:MAG TPA: hypothetical protein VH116_01455 [Gemmatimonadales bacterium]|jgi:hypothetical protein|nr:hypothetical protein [Gemmatimonadales bacterium]
MRLGGLLLLLAVGCAAALPAQAPAAAQNPTLRQALQAYDNLNFASALTLARRALTERMTGSDQARAYELLGFSYSATDSQVKAVDAFKQTILLDPDRDLDPRRISPKITSLFYAALGQVLVVRQLRVDSARFVGGQGNVPIRFTVTSPARVRTRAVLGSTSLLIDSAVVTGTVNLRWPAQLANGDPVPAGDWLIVVEATASQNTFSASQPVRVTHAAVDTVPHLTSLPGYPELPETEIAPQSWRPAGLAFLYTGGALVGTLGLESATLGSSSKRELGVVGGVALVTGFVMTLRKPSPRPAVGNILYNRLLRDQLVRRNQDITKENVTRRREVQLSAVPLKPAGGR